MSKYIIIDAEAIQKRIEECNKCLSFVNKEHDTPYQKEIDVLQSILSQSTPLIPEISKSYDAGMLDEKLSKTFDNPKSRYLNNLKLKI